jgi:hypothetical protein
MPKKYLKSHNFWKSRQRFISPYVHKFARKLFSITSFCTLFWMCHKKLGKITRNNFSFNKLFSNVCILYIRMLQFQASNFFFVPKFIADLDLKINIFETIKWKWYYIWDCEFIIPFYVLLLFRYHKFWNGYKVDFNSDRTMVDDKKYSAQETIQVRK